MKRKKGNETTVSEWVGSHLKGKSWEEAEDIAVEILSKCIALHVYVRGEGEVYLERLTERMLIQSAQWAKAHSLELAIAKVTINNNQKP